MGYRIGRESSQVSEEGFGIAGFGGARCWGRSVSGWATPGVARTSVVRARGGGPLQYVLRKMNFLRGLCMPMQQKTYVVYKLFYYRTIMRMVDFPAAPIFCTL